MKKILAILMALSLVLTCVGCSANEVNEPGDDKNISAQVKKQLDDLVIASNGIFPLEEQITLTAFVHTRPNVDNFDDNKMTYLLEELTNINFEFIVAAEYDVQEQLNLLMATGDYPDIILTSQLNAAQQALYGAQGILIPLNDYIESDGENTKRVFEEVPAAKERSTMPDGNIYNLPTVTECFHCHSPQKLWIYEPWLEAVGKELPETTEEFYEVLKAFATEDPNGNGIADEIPLAGANVGWEVNVEAFLMNAFVYNATSQSGVRRIFVDSGTVTASYATDGWKEGLKYLQRLRQDGLLAIESFTQDKNGLKQMGKWPDQVILGCFPGGSPSVAVDMSGERWLDYVAVPPLEGPNGIRGCKYDPYNSMRAAFSITSACEYPEIAFALGDLLYNQDISVMNSRGYIGEAWDWVDDEDKLGINGDKASWIELVPLGKQEPNGFWNQMGNYYESADIRLGRYVEDQNHIEVILYNETKDKYEPYYPSIETILPPMVLNENQSADILTYGTTIDTYVTEKLAEYILSDTDIDKSWEGYLSELDAMGLQQMLTVIQEVYEGR